MNPDTTEIEDFIFDLIHEEFHYLFVCGDERKWVCEMDEVPSWMNFLMDMFHVNMLNTQQIALA